MTKTDRRIIRTRQFIMQAFEELIKQKPFDKISVNEIADLANINRSTFYLHYVDKYALLDEYIDELLKDLYEQSGVLLQEKEFSGVEQCLSVVLNCLYEKRDIFKILFKRVNNPYFQPRFKSVIASIIAESTQPSDIEKTTESEFLIQVKTSALAGIIEWWLTDNANISVDAMIKNVSRVFFKLEDVKVSAK